MHEPLLWTLDPGQDTFGMAVFVGRRLLHLMTITPPKGIKIAREHGSRYCASAAFLWMASVRKAYGFLPGHKQTFLSEFPQAYVQGNNDRNDLFPLCATVGAIEAIFDGPTERVSPHTWKSNLPKEMKLAQIRRKLQHDENERMVLEAFLAEFAKNYTKKQADALSSHALDAAGIGLWRLGR